MNDQRLRRSAVSGLALVATLLSLQGCVADLGRADAEVVAFHAEVSEGNGTVIWQSATDDLKKSANEGQFLSLLQSIKRDLGPVKSAKRRSWEVSYRNGARLVGLVYDTEFANGVATEQFMYRVESDGLRLAGYHIKSEALRTTGTAI